jgi:hypothetical protein
MSGSDDQSGSIIDFELFATDHGVPVRAMFSCTIVADRTRHGGRG